MILNYGLSLVERYLALRTLEARKKSIRTRDLFGVTSAKYFSDLGAELRLLFGFDIQSHFLVLFLHVSGTLNTRPSLNK